MSDQIKQAEQAQHAQHDPLSIPPAVPDRPSSDPTRLSPPHPRYPRSASPDVTVKPPADRQHTYSRSASPRAVAEQPVTNSPGIKSGSVCPFEARRESRHSLSRAASPEHVNEDKSRKRQHSTDRLQTPVRDTHQTEAREEEGKQTKQNAHRRKPRTDRSPSTKAGSGGKGDAKDSLKRKAEHSSAGEAKRHKHNRKGTNDVSTAKAPAHAKPAGLHALKQKRRQLYGQLQEARQQVCDAAVCCGKPCQGCNPH